MDEVELIVIRDASLSSRRTRSGAAAVTELLGRLNLPTETLAASANVLLLRSGGELTLIDSSNGGNLLPSLEAVGVFTATV